MRIHYALKTVSAISLVMLLAMSTASGAEQDAQAVKTTSAEAADSSAQRMHAHRISKEKEKQLVKEAVQAVMETENALAALSSHKSKEALLDLDGVSAKLRAILAKNAELKLVPVSFQEETFIYEGNLDDIKATTQKADQLIGDQRIQDARLLLGELASEIRINIISLPLGEYPAGIEKAASLIVAGKEDEAKKTLKQLLDTLVTDVEVYPLPVLAAEADLSEAYELEHKSDLSKTESKEKILELADKAEKQLTLAKALGYGDEKDYKVLYQGIQALRETLHTNKSKAEWEKIKGSLGQLKNKITHPTT